MRLKQPFLLLMIMLGVFIASCTKSCAPQKINDNALVINVATPIESLDPRYATSSVAGRISHVVYGSLFDLGEDLLPYPLLAKSIEREEPRTFKIRLRENLQFHDKSPLTAADVVYTYTELKSSDVASPHGDKFNYVESITAEDERTIVFKLKHPFAPFLTDLCAIGIVSKKACKGRSAQCRHENIGSGPYKVLSWNKAKETIHLIPFEQWYSGKPKSELLFRVVRDENTRMLELLGKKVDITDAELSPTNIRMLKKQSFLEIKELPGLSYAYLAINVRGPRPEDSKETPRYQTRAALANKQVRRAIAEAIDFELIIKKLLFDTAVRVSGLIPNEHWSKDAHLSPPTFNPKEAERELDEAGFKRQGPKGIRFKLTISTTPNRLRQSIALLFADYLQKIGIDAHIRVKEWGALYQDMKQGQFEMFSAAWVPVTEPDLYYFVHHSSNIPEANKMGGNRHGYKNEAVDELIEKARMILEPELRKPLYQQIERLLLEDLPYIPLWNEDKIVIINKQRVRGYKPLRTGSYMSLINTSLNTSKSEKTN